MNEPLHRLTAATIVDRFKEQKVEIENLRQSVAELHMRMSQFKRWAIGFSGGGLLLLVAVAAGDFATYQAAHRPPTPIPKVLEVDVVNAHYIRIVDAKGRGRAWMGTNEADTVLFCLGVSEKVQYRTWAMPAGVVGTAFYQDDMKVVEMKALLGGDRGFNVYADDGDGGASLELWDGKHGGFDFIQFGEGGGNFGMDMQGHPNLRLHDGLGNDFYNVPDESRKPRQP